MNKIIKEALVLMAITLVSGLLLGAVYSITKQPIAQAEEKAQKEAYLAVFPDAQDLTEPDNKEELLTEAADVLDQAGFGTADTGRFLSGRKGRSSDRCGYEHYFA